MSSQRNAAAGAPRHNDGYVRDEEFDSRLPSPSPDSQRVMLLVPCEFSCQVTVSSSDLNS